MRLLELQPRGNNQQKRAKHPSNRESKLSVPGSREILWLLRLLPLAHFPVSSELKQMAQATGINSPIPTIEKVSALSHI